jgi:signal peptidase II
MRPWLVVALTVGCDQLTKLAIRVWLAPIQSLPVIPSILHLTYVQNTGAAFGLFQGHTVTFILLSAAVAAWIVLELMRKRHRRWSIELAMALILGGAIGNLVDRLVFGYVIDFIDVRVWPVFNVADSSITIGVGLLMWHALRHR